MLNAYESGAVSTVPAQGSSIGHPTDGVPGSTPATVPGAGWYDAVTTEILTAIIRGGGTPSAGSLTQLADVLFGTPNMTAAKGSIKLGPLLVNWGRINVSANSTAIFTFDTAFTTACFGVLPATYNNPFTSSGVPIESAPTVDGTPGKTGCVIRNWQTGDWSGTPQALDVFLIAIGT